MKRNFIIFLASAGLLASPLVSFGQAPPPLGAAASFAMFTAIGAVDNNGPSIINGDIGTNAGAFNGFPPGVVNGSIHVADTYATQAATAVQTAYGYYSTNIPCETPLAVYGGTPAVVMGPGSYCVGGATTLAGTLILDGGGDPNAMFYLKVAGALTTAQNSQVITQNGANPANVYWQIGGLTTLGQNSVMRGTLLVDGGIIMITGASIIGRGLSREGAIILTSATASVPSAVVPAVNATTWLGNGTTNWFDSANWSAGVPTSTVNAIVPAGITPYPNLISGTAQANGLSISSGASFAQNGGDLDLKAGLTNRGTFSATGGRLSLSGSSSQIIGGSGSTQLWDLSITNPAGAQQTGAVRVRGVLAPASGNLTTNGQTLTLLSQASGTALVDNSGTGTILGAVTMQRHINPSMNPGAGYRHYSAPVQNTTFNDLATPGFAPIFNQAYNSSPNPSQVRPYPNVFGYNEARITTAAPSFEQGYFVPAGTDPMVVMAGYSVNIDANELVDLRGTLNNGLITRNLTRGPEPESGWHLLGNPYASPINLSIASGITRTNMDDAIYVYESTGQYAGQYRSYINNMGIPVVPSMQGFFTRVSAGHSSGTFGLNNDVRVTVQSDQPPFFRGSDRRPLVQLSLQGRTLADETFVYFEQGASAAFDGRFDAVKLPNTSGLSLGSIAAGSELSINGLAPLAATTTVALNVAVPAAGTYTLQATSLANFAPNTQVLLLDTQTGARINLSQQTSYTFQAGSTTLPGRFSLHFGLNSPLASQHAALTEQVQLYPNPAQDSFTLLLPAELGRTPVAVTILNQLGKAVLSRTVPMTAAGATAQFNVASLAPGIYLLRLQSANGQVVKRVVIK